MDKVSLRSGTEVVIRPIGPADGPRLRDAYGRLSPISRYRRFLAPKPHLSASEVHYLVDVDGRNHCALVATLADDPDQIVGVARFVRLAEDPRAAEFSVVVGDPLHRQGLATALLQRLIELARDRGIARLRATILAENQPALRLVSGLSPHPTQRRVGAVNEIDLDVAA
jgi:RimJ/RimL family protein N-acetyltransferase